MVFLVYGLLGLLKLAKESLEGTPIWDGTIVILCFGIFKEIRLFGSKAFELSFEAFDILLNFIPNGRIVFIVETRFDEVDTC
jgi:hypothetical protein